jgi:spore maturation protein A
MLNYLWGGMILLAVAVAALTGNMSELTNATISSAKDAVTLCVTMLGVLSMWTGLMKVAEKAGLIELLARKSKPLLRFLMPELPRSHPAFNHIAMNFIANVLGLGWAATPSGLKAMEELQKSNKQKDTANRTMRMFMVVNMSSLQLVSMNIIAYRMQYNSANPSEIIGPGLLATLVSTAGGIIFCKIMDGYERAKEGLAAASGKRFSEKAHRTGRMRLPGETSAASRKYQKNERVSP